MLLPIFCALIALLLRHKIALDEFEEDYYSTKIDRHDAEFNEAHLSVWNMVWLCSTHLVCVGRGGPQTGTHMSSRDCSACLI